MTKHDMPNEKGGRKQDENRDPISGAPGAHPVGTGAGALAGAASGAAIGTAFGGPIGTAAGGIAGAVVGGLAGKGVAEQINPTVENEYWRDHYSTRPYASAAQSYDSIQPAYRYGWESRSANTGKSWMDVESDLGEGWEKARGNSDMPWDRAKPAVQDAWDRIDNDHSRMDDDGAMNQDRAKKPGHF